MGDSKDPLLGMSRPVEPLPMADAVEFVRAGLQAQIENLLFTANALEQVGLSKPATQIHHAVESILYQKRVLVKSYGKHLDELVKDTEENGKNLVRAAMAGVEIASKKDQVS